MITPRYRALDDAEIARTLERLHSRIAERFPESGLRKVCEELIAVGGETKECVAYLRSPLWPVRIVVGSAIAAMIVIVLVMVTRTLQLPSHIEGQAEVVQVIDATASSAVFMGLAVLYLLRIEPWLKLSALLVQYLNDPVLLGAVDEIETLATGLQGKIWQKIQLLDRGRITNRA